MAIQPETRMAGSEHHLRFIGVLELETEGDTTVQTTNGAVVTSAVADTPTRVWFALADMTALTDKTKRLPEHVYDDAQPAGTAPHSNTLSNMGPGAVTPTGKTYAQNIKVRAHEATVSTATPLIARVDVLNPVVEIDGAAGFGLGQGTGVPVVGIDIHFTAAGILALADQENPGVAFALEVEVPHTIGR